MSLNPLDIQIWPSYAGINTKTQSVQLPLMQLPFFFFCYATLLENTFRTHSSHRLGGVQTGNGENNEYFSFLSEIFVNKV